MSAPLGRVIALWRYPVKSMQGESLEEADVGAQGLLGDRAYALTEARARKLASAKRAGRWGALLECQAAYVEPPQHGRPLPQLRIRLPGSTLVAGDGAQAAALVSRALGEAVALAGPRAEDPYFDAAPIHLITTAALERLRTRYPAGRFDPRRFRPNILLELAQPAPGFPEEDWIGRTIALGAEVRLQITAPCERCVMTTLAQDELPHDPGILQALERRGGASLGVYATVACAGRIRRGDPLRLIED